MTWMMMNRIARLLGENGKSRIPLVSLLGRPSAAAAASSNNSTKLFLPVHNMMDQ